MNKNILIVTCWFPNKENPQQGSFILDHVKSLTVTGAQCQVLYFHIIKGNKKLKLKEYRYIKEGIAVKEIVISSIFWKFIYQWPLLIKSHILQYTQKIKNENFDIVHSHAIFPAGFFGFWIAKVLQKPFVLTEHWSRASSFLRKHPLGQQGKKIYNNANALIFVSPFLKNKISPYLNTNKPIFIIPNPINGDVFNFHKKPPKDIIRYTLIAGWKKRSPKRGDIILEAFHKIMEESPFDFQINFIGDGDAIDDYKKKAAEYNLPVCFCGFKNKKQVSEHLQKSHFFIHPTEFETFGIVIYEALKTGTPVLASNIEVFKEIISDYNGKLVNNTSEDWKNAILLTKDNFYDYKKIAKAFSSAYSPFEIGHQTNQVYNLITEHD